MGLIWRIHTTEMITATDTLCRMTRSPDIIEKMGSLTQISRTIPGEAVTMMTGIRSMPIIREETITLTDISDLRLIIEKVLMLIIKDPLPPIKEIDFLCYNMIATNCSLYIRISLRRFHNPDHRAQRESKLIGRITRFLFLICREMRKRCIISRNISQEKKNEECPHIGLLQFL